MATAETQRQPDRPAGSAIPESRIGLRISAYDQVASLLISLLILIGFLVALLLIIWLTSRLMFVPRAVPVELLEYSGRGDHAAGYERDIEEPGMEELDELMEPQLEATLDAVTELVSTQAAAYDAIETAAASSSKGSGMGDSRGPGPLGDGRDDIVPPWDRWEIRFASSSMNAYARQLDFFKIELGAAGGGSSTIDYASNLRIASPATRRGDPESEDRLYMSWRDPNSPLAAFDRQLLAKAGIATQRRLVLQFYPKDVERLLMTIEASTAEARRHKPQEFLKTIFGVREAGNGYEFYVIDQIFRPAPAL